MGAFTDAGADETSDEYIERIPDSRNDYTSLENRQQLEQAAEVLSPREKTVIEDIYFLGLSQKEVAAELNITVQRVSQIRRQALRKLKKRIEE
ncbi:MAG: sigma-70 family RNA polymerase sigma factor [Schwartzia sp.]|nr:sigma-70 family RNA polymerase sigma factor [Schwartzia sp. (in: firmicutes)]